MQMPDKHLPICFLLELSDLGFGMCPSCWAPSHVHVTGEDSFLKKIYSFIHSFILERQRERGRDTGRRSRLHAGSLMWDLIPGPQDNSLSRRQTLNS